jgi:hypothetical protein
MSTTGEPNQKLTSTTVEVVANERAESQIYGGSNCHNWNERIANQVGNSLWTPVGSKYSDSHIDALSGSAGALVGISPRDTLEGMAAAQLIAAHEAVMECHRRAMLPNQSFEGREASLSQANKLSRTWATLLDARNKHRGKGQQRMTVEHVHVHAGGQAVVGTVEGGGATKKQED